MFVEYFSWKYEVISIEIHRKTTKKKNVRLYRRNKIIKFKKIRCFQYFINLKTFLIFTNERVNNIKNYWVCIVQLINRGIYNTYIQYVNN